MQEFESKTFESSIKLGITRCINTFIDTMKVKDGCLTQGNRSTGMNLIEYWFAATRAGNVAFKGHVLIQNRAGCTCSLLDLFFVREFLPKTAGPFFLAACASLMFPHVQEFSSYPKTLKKKMCVRGCMCVNIKVSGIRRSGELQTAHLHLGIQREGIYLSTKIVTSIAFICGAILNHIIIYIIIQMCQPSN